MSELVAIGILGAVGLVVGINQLQNKSNPSAIPRPSQRVSQRHSQRASQRPSQRASQSHSQRHSQRASQRHKPTSMHWDKNITKPYKAIVSKAKIKTQTVFMELLVQANYNNDFDYFDKYFDFVLKQPKIIVIQLFNHRHIDIDYGTGSCLSALFIFKNYKYILDIIEHFNYHKDILNIKVSDGAEQISSAGKVADQYLLNFGQLLWLFKSSIHYIKSGNVYELIESKIPNEYKFIKLKSLLYLIPSFESDFNKIFYDYKMNGELIGLNDYINEKVFEEMMNTDIEIDNIPQNFYFNEIFESIPDLPDGWQKVKTSGNKDIRLNNNIGILIHSFSRGDTWKKELNRK